VGIEGCVQGLGQHTEWTVSVVTCLAWFESLTQVSFTKGKAVFVEAIDSLRADTRPDRQHASSKLCLRLVDMATWFIGTHPEFPLKEVHHLMAQAVDTDSGRLGLEILNCLDIHGKSENCSGKKRILAGFDTRGVTSIFQTLTNPRSSQNRTRNSGVPLEGGGRASNTWFCWLRHELLAQRGREGLYPNPNPEPNPNSNSN